MSPGKITALFAGYGFREESVSLFEKIRRNGIAATAASRMGLREDPFGKLGLVPLESALAGQRGQLIPPPEHILVARLYFYHYPKSVVDHAFSPSQYILGRTRDQAFYGGFGIRRAILFFAAGCDGRQNGRSAECNRSSLCGSPLAQLLLERLSSRKTLACEATHCHQLVGGSPKKMCKISGPALDQSRASVNMTLAEIKRLICASDLPPRQMSKRDSWLQER